MVVVEAMVRTVGSKEVLMTQLDAQNSQPKDPALHEQAEQLAERADRLEDKANEAYRIAETTEAASEVVRNRAEHLHEKAHNDEGAPEG